MKLITVCGSMGSFDQMLVCAEKLQLEKGWAVLLPVPHVLDREMTQEQKETMGELHRRKIAVSDGIYVVNVKGYIGDAVRQEIAFAQRLGKEIYYLEEQG